VREKKFRADLYYRLNVVNLEVPPLRERKEDIIPLAEYFLVQQSEFYGEPQKTLSTKVKRLLINYSWPGNVRELANAMERAYILSPFREIRTLALPQEIITSDTELHPEALLPTIDAAQRKLITEALEFTSGRKIAAAKILGIERRRLNRLIQRLNIPLTDIKKNIEE
jgi:DNA-binding NtrC family response regulator